MPKGKESPKDKQERYLRLQRLIEKELIDFFRDGGGVLLEDEISAPDLAGARDQAIDNMDPRLKEAGVASGMLRAALDGKDIPLSRNLHVKLTQDDQMEVTNTRTGKTHTVDEIRRDSNGRYRDTKGRFL